MSTNVIQRKMSFRGNVLPREAKAIVSSRIPLYRNFNKSFATVSVKLLAQAAAYMPVPGCLPELKVRRIRLDLVMVVLQETRS